MDDFRCRLRQRRAAHRPEPRLFKGTVVEAVARKLAR
jgi:hypothetical protein